MVALVLLVAITTGIRFDNGPIYDDPHVLEGGIIDRPELALQALTERTMFISRAGKKLPPEVDTYRPIPAESFFLNAAISGRKLWSYHLLNLLLHVGCVLLLFSLIRRFIGRGRIKAAALGAGFFAVHPWLAEAHVWINGRSDPLALLFGLGAALVLIGKRPTPARLAGAFVLFFCGLASKETLLVTIPAFLFLDPKRTSSWRDRILRVVPLVIAAVAYLALRVRILHGMKTHPNTSALLSAAARGPALLVDALFRLLVPETPFFRSLRDDFVGLSAALLAGALVVVLVLAYLVFRYRKTLTSAPFAALFFAGALAPVAGITMQVWPGYGRYLYLPAAGLAVLLAEIGARYGRRLQGNAKKIGAAVLALYFVVMAALLVNFTRDMSGNEPFYMTATEKRPNQAYGFGFLGAHYLTIGDDDPGIGALKRAVELDPLDHRYRSNLVHALMRHGRCEEAVPLAMTGLERFGSTSFAPAFHAALGKCAPTVELAVRNLHLCILTDLDANIEFCDKKLRERVATDPKARAALRDAMKQVPNVAFDAEWGPLVRDSAPE